MRSSQGYIAITAVLVLSALFLSMSISVASRGITASDTSYAGHMEKKVRYITEACVEYGLLRLRDTYRYAGGETISIGDEQCVIMPIAGGDTPQRTLHAYSMIDGYTYRVEVIISMEGSDIEVVTFDRVRTF